MGKPPMRTPAPLLGQHTREVLAEVLDLDDATIDELAAQGVLE
jgi:crotonobetainyl-CoA:carnitine CoA-transferase CaiB-like acyl-CoA transferase